MKNLYLLLIFSVFVGFFAISAQSLEIDNTLSVDQLISNSLFDDLGACEVTSNELSTINGTSDTAPITSFASFLANNNNGFNLTEGIVLTTGRASQANANTAGAGDGTMVWSGNTDYEDTVGITAGSTFNATEIEFDFFALQDNVMFNYVFASDEYVSNVSNYCTNNDGVIILIKEAGTSDPFVNIALTPDGRAVTVANIHEEVLGTTPETSCAPENETLIANGGARSPDTKVNYGQYTETLQAQTNSIIGLTYTVKIIIADNNDTFSDSAVFIQKIINETPIDLGRLDGSVLTKGDISDCVSSVVISPEQSYPSSVEYLWSRAGDASFSASTRTIDVSESDRYTLRVSLNSFCFVESEIDVQLLNPSEGSPISDYNACVLGSQTSATVNLEIKNGEALIDRDAASSVTYFSSLEEAKSDSGMPIANPNNYTANANDTIYAIVTEPSGCKFISSFQITIGQGETIENKERLFLICDAELVIGEQVFDADGFEGVFTPEITDEFFSGVLGTFSYYEDASLSIPFDESKAYSGSFTIYAQNTSPSGCTSNALPIDITINTPPTGVPYDETEGANAIFEEIIICDSDDPKDGYVEFDLSPIRDRILASGITGVDVSFHGSVADAGSGENPITNISNYINDIENIQRVAFRIIKTGEECPIVRPVTLKARHLRTDSTFNDENTCDEDNDGFAVFDLSGKKDEISTEYEVELYASIEDFNSNSPIPESELAAYTNTVIDSQTIHVRLIDAVRLCEDRDVFDLIVFPTVTVNTPTDVIICDQDSDGVIENVLSIFQAEVTPQLTSDISLGVRYYTNEVDANNSDDPSVQAVQDTDLGSSGTYWIRATSGAGCIAVKSFQLQVNPAPNVTDFSPIYVCYDAIGSVPLQDITQNVSSTDASQYNFDYYTEAASANMTPKVNEDLIPSSETASYDITQDSDGIIWVRIEDKITECITVLQQEFIVNTIPVVINSDDFLLCVEQGSSVAADFNLRSRDPLIMGAQEGKIIRYYSTSIDDANAGGSDGEITDPEFSSTIPERTVYFRIENDDDINCFVTGQFNLKIEENATTPTLDRLTECEGDKPSTAFFNLNDAVAIITNNGAINDITVDFYANEDDAGYVASDQGIQVPEATGNKLPLMFENQTPLSQEIIARITNFNGCVTFDTFILVVDERPEVAPLTSVDVCDTNNDGSEMINLREIEGSFAFIYAGRPKDLATDDGVLYFKTEEDRSLHTDASPLNIDADSMFEINSSITDIYLKITSDTGCIFETAYAISLNPLPVITPKNITYCESSFGSNSFVIDDLERLNQEFQFVDPTNPFNENVEIRYYSDAGGTNQLTGSYTKTNSDNEIYAQAYNTITSCVSTRIVRLELIANPLPDLGVPDALDLIVCDTDGILDGIADFIFSNLNEAILNGLSESDFIVSYHNTQQDADRDIILSGDNRATTKSYVAKLTNVMTSCYNTLSFNIVVSSIPQIEPITQIIERCDAADDGEELFALNSIESAFVLSSGAESDYTVRYYTSASRDSTTELIGSEIDQYPKTTFGEQTIYIVLVSNTTTKCAYESEFKINLIQLPQINEQTESIKYCEGELFGNLKERLTAVLIDDPSNVTVTYHTDISGSASSEIQDTTTVPNTQIYIKSGANTSICNNTEPVMLEEVPLPVINAVELERRTVCDVDEFNDGFFAFDYTSLNGAILGSQDPTNYSVSYHLTRADAESNKPISKDRAISSGTYYIKVLNAITMCESIGEIQLFIDQIPIIEIEDVTFCINNPSRIIDADTGNGNDVFYEWTFKDALGNSTRPAVTDSKTVELSPSDIGAFVTLEVRNNSVNECAAFKTFEVKVSRSADIEIDEIVKGFDLNQITVEVSSDGDYTYGYDDPDPANSQDSNIIENVLPGKHTVWVFDKSGCEPSMKEFIFIDYFPYFTPNGSGPIETETWHIIAVEEIPGTFVYIYNRYGKLLKTLTSDSEGWDGTFNGTPVPTDDYWILIKMPDGEEIKDHITLKR